MLLIGARPAERSLLKAALHAISGHPSARVVRVSNAGDLSKAAGALSRALFGETV